MSRRRHRPGALKPDALPGQGHAGRREQERAGRCSKTAQVRSVPSQRAGEPGGGSEQQAQHAGGDAVSHRFEEVVLGGSGGAVGGSWFEPEQFCSAPGYT